VAGGRRVDADGMMDVDAGRRVAERETMAAD
jgi:hypothetical protein